MTRRKPVVAWVVPYADGNYGVWRDRPYAKGIAETYGSGRVVKLVEHSPTAAAVVRAAVKLVAERFETSGDELVKAVERHLKAGKR